MPIKESHLTPSPGATGFIVAGMFFTSGMLSRIAPSEMAHMAAIYSGLTLLISFYFDMRRDFRRLVRADIMALCALYFLTLFEFLFPQPLFDSLVGPEEAEPAINACLFAFIGLALGRHLAPPGIKAVTQLLQTEFQPKMMLTLFWISIGVGYFYMLLTTNFDLSWMLHDMMGPRFTQAWSRGRLGGWKELLGELGMLLNIAPPIAGIIIARRRSYSSASLALVSLALGFTFFYGFVSGTRNVLITFIATFTVAYAFSLEKNRLRELAFVVGLAIATTLAATVYMLEFRKIGFLNYINGQKTEANLAIEAENKKETTLFVDYNLYVIAKLINVFPGRHPFLGFEVPYLALIRPIPRAIWKGKPEGLSMSIEDALGTEGLTLASSFVGEAYISGGNIGVVLCALVFGSVTGWWNRFGDPNNSPFGHLVFASGFFAAVISMRSMFVFTTAILPTIAALVLGHWLLSQLPKRRKT